MVYSSDQRVAVLYGLQDQDLDVTGSAVVDIRDVFVYKRFIDFLKTSKNGVNESPIWVVIQHDDNRIARGGTSYVYDMTDLNHTGGNYIKSESYLATHKHIFSDVMRGAAHSVVANINNVSGMILVGTLQDVIASTFT